MSSTFTPSTAIDQSKEKEWPVALGMLDWDNTNIIFTKRSLVEFLKYTGTTVDPNFTNIQKLPRYAKFGTMSASEEAFATSESAEKDSAQFQSQTLNDGFKPTRRVRQVPGGQHSDIFGHEDEDDASSSAPQQQQVDSKQNSAPVASSVETTAQQEETGINFPSSVKPSRRVRTVPGGNSSMSSLWDPEEPAEEFKPTRRVRQGPGGQDHINGLF